MTTTSPTGPDPATSTTSSRRSSSSPARAGYFLQDLNTEGIFQGDRFQYQNSNIGGCTGCPDDPGAVPGPDGLPELDHRLHTETVQDKFTRMSLQTDATWFADLGGKHEFKAGVQYDMVKNDVLERRDAATCIRIYWGTAFGCNPANRGAYGYYRLRTNTFEPEPRVPDRRRDPEQQPRPLPPGLLDDRPEADPEPRPPHRARDGPELRPRGPGQHRARLRRRRSSTSASARSSLRASASPMTSRATARRRSTAAGACSTTSSSWPCRAARSAATSGSTSYYTLDTPNPADLSTCEVNTDGHLRRQLPGPPDPAPVDFRHPSFDYLEYDADGKPVLDPYRLQELSGGIEHSLTSNSSVALRYVHKQIDKAIEDIGFLDRPGQRGLPDRQPGLQRERVAWTLTTARRSRCPRPSATTTPSRRSSTAAWPTAGPLRVSYLWSRLDGNYSGLAQADEPGRADPNVGRLFDYPIMMFDQTGRPPSARCRPTGRTSSRAVHLRDALRSDRRAQRVRRERRRRSPVRRRSSPATTTRSST